MNAPAPIRPDFEPGRLWSLWDIMINYQIFGLYGLLKQLLREEADIERRIAILDSNKMQPGFKREIISGIYIDELITEEDCMNAKKWLDYAASQAEILDLQPAKDRIELFFKKIRVRVRLHVYLSEVRTLREAFESGINIKCFYLYPQEKAHLVGKIEHEWKNIISSFK